MGLFGRRKSEAASAPAEAVTVQFEDGRSVSASVTVDCLGDSCPRPQLMTKKALAAAPRGQVIAVKIDNPTSLEAVHSMIPDLGGRHLGTAKLERGWTVVVERL